ncbi:MAG: hypothetical protein QM767_22550 [Anaeromyxobacter sp.]
MRRPVTALLLLALAGCTRCREEVPAPVPPEPAKPTTGALVPLPAPLPASAPAPAGPTAEAEAWTVALETPAATAGAPAQARVRIGARGTFHVNPDYPLSFSPDPAATARFSGERVALGTGAERTPCAEHPEHACALTVALPFTAPPAGAARLAGTLAFSVCNDDRCLIEKVALAADAPVR